MGESLSGRALLQNIPINKVGIASMKDYQPLLDMQLEHFYFSE